MSCKLHLVLPSVVFVVFAVLLLPSIFAVCPLTLHGKCSCDPINLITKCSNANITEILTIHDIPIQTKALIMTGNNLTELPIDAFGVERNHPKPLQEMDLSNNNIRKIHEQTFRDLNSLRKLVLNDNKISITGDDYPSRLFENLQNLEELHLKSAFVDTDNPKFTENLLEILENGKFEKLKILSLEANGIKQFHSEDFFCSLGSLQKLFLANNDLEQIRFNLSCTERLRTLDLSYNRLVSLDNVSISFIEQLPRSFHVNMSGNPFRCDCSMGQFLKWLQQTPLFVMNKDNYVCNTGYPLTNVYRRLITLGVSNLQCDPSLSIYFAWSNYISFIVIVLGCCAMAFMVVVLFKLRHHAVELCFQPCGNLSTKQYSALKKDEKTEITRETRVVEISV